MKKRSTGTKEAGAKAGGLNGEVVGVDLGDRTSDCACWGRRDDRGGRSVQTTQAGIHDGSREEADASGDGSGDAFAVAEPAADGVGA